jgi:hypothetical protein
LGRCGDRAEITIEVLSESGSSAVWLGAASKNMKTIGTIGKGGIPMKQPHPIFAGALLALLAIVPSRGGALAQEPAVDMTGVWEISSESPRGAQTRTITFEQDGATLTGTMETQMGSVPIEGSVEGNEITFTMTLSRGERSFEMVYTGTVEGDTAKGTMLTPRGETEWTGKRVEGQ